MSGGFPHSDIHGSKPIPGSPWLNAGYHVLHRLLLPRHPPNALFALDLTRKEQGRWFKWPASLPASKVVYLPMRAANAPPLLRRSRQSPHTVSVLDLEQYHPQGSNPQASPYSGRQMILMFLTLNDVNFIRRSDDQTLRTGLDDRIFFSRDTGGAYRDRTDDLLNANQALSQLS